MVNDVLVLGDLVLQLLHFLLRFLFPHNRHAGRHLAWGRGVPFCRGKDHDSLSERSNVTHVTTGDVAQWLVHRNSTISLSKRSNVTHVTTWDVAQWLVRRNSTICLSKRSNVTHVTTEDVAQRLARQNSNPRTLGSIPWQGRFFLSFRINSCADLFVPDTPFVCMAHT